MHNVVALLTLIAIVGLLVYASIRAARIKWTVVRWGGVGLSAVLAAAVSVLSVLTIVGLFKSQARYAPVPTLKVAGTPEQIQRGRAIADSFCDACHSTTGPLTGGENIGEHFPMPIGSFVSSNLTPAGQFSRWSDGAIFRAIRNSVDADGRWLIVMSYTNASKLSDQDIHALIAYIRSRPTTGRATVNPPDRLSLLGAIMLGAGMLPTGKPVLADAITAPAKGPTVPHGEYIVSYQDCRECHGARLTGGVKGQLGPIGPDLSPVKQWRREEFIATMRTGINPYGRALSQQMPWRPIGRMDDEELAAVYEYLTHLPGSQATATN
jgi:mono/diheme cytochrome c family protein